MKTLNDILEECAHESGFPTYLYARVDEANVDFDHINQYPAILRVFGDRIKETKFKTSRTRIVKLYFADALGLAEPSTSYCVAPVIGKVETRAFEFVNLLRERVTEVEVTDANDFIGKFDTLMAGVYMELNITYSTC